MNRRTTNLVFLSLCLLLAACTTDGQDIMESPTVSSGATETTAVPITIPSQPAGVTMQTYQNDYYSLQYPGQLAFYENERPSADGVIAQLENGIAMQGPNFLLTITTFEVVPGRTLADFIDGHVECLEVNSSGGQPAIVGNLEGKLYADTLCGLNGITYFYGVRSSTGYRFTIESTDSFVAVQPAVQPILDSLQVADAPTGGTGIEHNGISLMYDPALLGNANIQDVLPSANQGMFDQPSPAHTWIGFVPAGVQRDVGNHWLLLREPQVIVFGLNDFGSFAPADAQARDSVAAFRQILMDRPTTFSEEIPILPPINAAQTIHAQAKWLDFAGGTGLRFVTAYSQDTLPVTNDRLLYIFYGITNDGQHGITAVFPLAAAGLPESVPSMSEADFAAFSQNYAAEMAAVTDQLNNLPVSGFNPLLSQLDSLVQSIAVKPTEADYAVTTVTPQNGQLLADADIFAAPSGEATIDSLAAGEAVVINGLSSDGSRSRILCLDGTTGNCWIAADAVQVTAIETLVLATYSGAVEGQVVQIQAVSDNAVYAAPGETATVLGRLLAGEVAEVYAPDESGQWLNIACPRGIGLACWVVSDADVNLPIGFYGGDGWQDVSGDYVSFRAPMNWQPTAVSFGGGNVLAEWHLGIPGVETDQIVAFSAVPFIALQPNDIASEYEFEIGNQPGVKWVRTGLGYISYDYYTAGTASTQAAGAGSFGIHVTVANADPELEANLDMLAASVIFTE